MMTYVAQFLQYSNDMPAPDDHLQVGNQTDIFNRSVKLTFTPSKDFTAELRALLPVKSTSSLLKVNCRVIVPLFLLLFLPLLLPSPV